MTTAIQKLDSKSNVVTHVAFVHPIIFKGVRAGELDAMKRLPKDVTPVMTLTPMGVLVFHRDENRLVPWTNIISIVLEDQTPPVTPTTPTK